MTLVLENLDEEVAPEELAEMGSLNHGYLQLKIGAYFLTMPDLTPSSEVTLDVSKLSEVPGIEFVQKPNLLEPDIAVFDKLAIDFQNDLLRSEETPLLVIEILSPMQGVKTLVDKVKIYFALGVRSCWLVYPYAKSIAVYRASDEFEMFSKGDVIDDVANVRLPLSDIFS